MRAYLRAIVSAAVAVPLFALAACDETVEATKIADSGATTGDAGDSGAADAGPSLFDRLGGTPGITALVDAIVTEEVKDPEILSFFAPNTLNPPPNGKPTVAQIKGCLVLQISAALDATKFTYPGKLQDGYQCRDMKTSHAALHIPSSTFDKFAAIATGVVQAAASKNPALTPDDLKLVGTFLAAQKPLIVDPDASAPVVDGGNDAASITDASDSG